MSKSKTVPPHSTDESTVEGSRPKRKKTGGRKKGTPNKSTADARAAMALICQNLVGKLEQWIKDIPDPAVRANTLLRAMEFHVPKLNRTIFTGGESNEPVRILVEGVSPPASPLN